MSAGQLSDGVLLFDLLHQVSSKHFVKNTITRKLGENWALKITNLHKIVNNLDIFFREELHKTAHDILQTIDITAIARHSDMAHILKLFSIVAAAAVQCENRGLFVSLILKMSPSGQECMKEILEGALLNIYHLDVNVSVNTSVISTPGAPTPKAAASSFSVDHPHDFGESSSSPFDLYDAHSCTTMHSTDKGAPIIRTSLNASSSSPVAFPLMKRDLNNEFLRAEMKEMESSNRALVDKVSALNGQLREKQREAASMANEMREMRQAMQRKEDEVQQLRDRNRALEDDISIAQAQGQKLRQAEATITAYRDKLESMHSGSQLEEIEAQSASTLVKQIVEMKAAVANIPSLQRAIDDYKSRNLTLKKNLDLTVSSVREKDKQIVALESRLSISECAKALAESELAATREMEEIRDMDMKRTAASAMSSAMDVENKDQNSSPSRVVEVRSLRQKNNKLRDRIAALESKLCFQEIQSKVNAISNHSSVGDNGTILAEQTKVGTRNISSDDSSSLLRIIVTTVNRLIAVFALPFVLVGFVVLSNLLVTSCPAPF
uniref:HOOK N-terminal domain-containing protein n=1 Tax=Leptocylindrus danicus TaxID=163516 RepID=A0A7S2PHT1_9STRA